MNKDIGSYISGVSECTFIAYFFIHSFFPLAANALKEACLLIMVGCWVSRMLYEKRVIFTKTSINIPILSLLLCLLISSFFSSNIKRNLESVFHDDVRYLIIFFGMVNTIQSREQIKRIVKAMLITFGLVCAFGLYKHYTNHETRIEANFEYYSIFAKYISLLLPIAIALLFSYKSIPIRCCLALLVGISSFCLILTMTRTSWIAVFSVTIFISFAAQKKYFMLVLIVTGLCLILILPSKFIKQAKTIVQVDKYFASEKILGQRVLGWKVSTAVIKDHPLFGIGPSSRIFREMYYQYAKEIRDKKVENDREQGSRENTVIPEQSNTTKETSKRYINGIEKLAHPHNVFLHVGVEAGIVGISIFLWLFVTIFYAAIRSWRSLNAGYEKMLLLGIIASLIAIFFNGITNTFWRKPDILFLWYIIGILFVVIHSNTSNSSQSDPLQENSPYN